MAILFLFLVSLLQLTVALIPTPTQASTVATRVERDHDANRMTCSPTPFVPETKAQECHQVIDQLNGSGYSKLHLPGGECMSLSYGSCIGELCNSGNDNNWWILGQKVAMDLTTNLYPFCLGQNLYGNFTFPDTDDIWFQFYGQP
ncbi:hypothetical protein QBC35DRAFT_456475 [Podospora australis]|uniref:Cyanovirin-N domain-containing protein n=1 Tax=Podospora australis TaxID=1536484 RepID=A0AAN6WJI4_9PEZI|nr:hypothetical protein QBC35DRAFT_456475 [Podospora australis]